MAETSEKVRHAGPPEIQRTLQGWGKQRLSDKLFSESHYYSFICIRQSSGASTTPGYGQEKSEAADQLVVESTRITDIAKLIGFLSENNDSDFTILSIDRDNRIRPLNSSLEGIHLILEHYNIDPEFYPILMHCASNPNMSRDPMDTLRVRYTADKTFTIQYRLRYAERNGRSEGNPWSIRQTGLHHRLSTVEKTGHAIFFHPIIECSFQEHLEDMSESSRLKECCTTRPLSLHIRLLSHYLSKWPEYLDHIGSEFSNLSDRVFLMDLGKQRGIRSNTELDCMQQLRHLESGLLPLPSILRSNLRIISAIDSVNLRLVEGSSIPEKVATETTSFLEFQAEQLRTHIDSVELLLKHISGALSLLVDSLAIQDHTFAESMSRNMLFLAKNSTQDSAAIRVITVVTLLFLPSTFIATIFGMNFFGFDSDHHSIQASPQIWIFSAVSVFLTAITVGCWLLVLRKRSAKSCWKGTNEAQRVLV